MCGGKIEFDHVWYRVDRNLALRWRQNAVPPATLLQPGPIQWLYPSFLATTKARALKEEPVVRSDCKHNRLSTKAQHHDLRPSTVAAFKKSITISQHFSRL